MIKIQNRVYRLKKASSLAHGMELPEGQEIEIVQDVVYMGGYMIQPELQSTLYNWIVNNPNLFEDITRNW